MPARMEAAKEDKIRKQDIYEKSSKANSVKLLFYWHVNIAYFDFIRYNQNKIKNNLIISCIIKKKSLSLQ